MKKLLQYLKPFRREVILGPVFKLAEAVLELIVPLVMARIIDIGVKNADGGYVLRMGGLMAALSASGLIFSLICQYSAAKASQGFGTALRNRLFAHIGRLSHAELDAFGAPTLVTRVTNDVTQLQVAVAMFIRLAVRAPFLVIGAAVMAMTIDFQVSLIFLAAAGGIALTLYLVMCRAAPLYARVQKLLDRVSLLTRENLSGARVIRAFSRQREEKGRFYEASDELMETSVRAGRLSALLNPATSLIVNAGIVAVLWFGGGTVNAGRLGQGQIIALVNYMTQILLALVVVANLVILFTRAGASAARVREVLDTRPSVADAGGATREKAREDAPIIEFRGVSFSYGGREPVLCDVDLKIMRGQWVGIIGGTGAGKTTLIDLIPRFYDAEKGSVLVGGVDVKRYPLARLRGKIGVAPQKSALFSGTVAENLLWGNKDATEEQMRKALDTAQAGEFVFEREEGLNALVRQDGRNLSGGQRQRLAIARALVRGPEILILDDASSALDYATDAALRKALRAYGGMTVVMVSQRAAALRHADVIVAMDDGRVAGIGTHEELFGKSGVYREIVLSQTHGKGETPQ